MGNVETKYCTDHQMFFKFLNNRTIKLTNHSTRYNIVLAFNINDPYLFLLVKSNLADIHVWCFLEIGPQRVNDVNIVSFTSCHK